MEFYSTESTHIYKAKKFENIVFQTAAFDLGLFFGSYPERSSEDCLFFTESKDHILLGIADGAGGHQRAADASEEAAMCLVDLFHENPEFDILQGIQKANEAVLDLKCGARTTLNFCRINKESYQAVNIGDSELIHWNTKQKILFQSTAQTVPGLLYKAEELSAKETLEHPLRSQVYHLLGDQNLTSEIAIINDFKVGHSILVGCDGLFDNFTTESLTKAFSGPDFREQFFKFTLDLETQLFEQKLSSLDDTSFALIRKKATSF